MFHVTSPGDSRTSWPRELTRVPPLLPLVLNELRRALYAVVGGGGSGGDARLYSEAPQRSTCTT
eukprot:3111263-Pleurochrysis_carterae.AAC.4